MRLGLFVLVIGLLLFTTGYVSQSSPQCKDEVQVRVVSRNVYDEIIANAEIPRNLF